MLDKKPIRQFGKIYDYLKDDELARELGKQRLTIRDADFSGERFNGVQWQYFDFIDCKFEGSYSIHLEWLTNSTFTNCHFGGHFGLGHARDVKFLRCKVAGYSTVSFFSQSTNLVFENCEFTNTTRDPNHRGTVFSDGELTLIDCQAKWFGWQGYKKMTLRRCITYEAKFGTAAPGEFSDKTQMPYSDFLIEDCDLRGGVEMINAKLNSLIFRRNRLNEFALRGAVIKGNALFEEIKEGFLRAAADYQGKLIIRNCNFPGTGEQKYSFEVNADTPTHTLLENITCGRKPVDIIRQFQPIEKWDDPPPNKLIVVKNCKIPHLQANWAQTEHLKIENCEFDSLHIEDGRIGKLEIIGCTLSRLNVSRTQVKEQNVGIYEGSKYSGHITTTDGSNIKLVPRD